MPPQKSPKKQEKASAAEKTKSADRDWLTTAELATKLGWREHSLRDALRQSGLPGVHRTAFGYKIESASVDERDALRQSGLPGVHRTAFGYKIESASVDELGAALGQAPAKGNSSLKGKTKTS